MNDKARTAVQRVQETNRRLTERHDPGRALQDALAIYDEHSTDCRHGNDPETCKICEDKERLKNAPPADPTTHHDHVHISWGPLP